VIYEKGFGIGAGVYEQGAFAISTRDNNSLAEI
jgi:hypothetical protein